MPIQLVSAYAASRLLGRDRQTIERAVRHLAPDGFEKGGPRWELSRVAAAVAMSPHERRESGKFRDRYSIRSKALDGLRVMFEKQITAIKAEQSPAKRRALAVALAPLLSEYQVLYLDIGRSLRIADDDVLGARADLIWGEMMDEVSAAAEWSRDDGFFEEMHEATWPHDDDGEAA